MTLRHFKIFQHLCHSLNMTRTAEALYMTQPSVSQVIRELEEHYQCLLFDRVGRKLVLTVDGHALQDQAAELLTGYEKIEAHFKDAPKAKSIRIGASATVGTYLLPVILKQYQRQFPNISVSVYVANTTEVMNLLSKSELDLAIVEGNIHKYSMTVEDLCEDKLILVGSAQHFLKRPTLKELASCRFLMRESGSGSAEQASEQLRKLGIRPEIIGTVNSIEALRHLVLAGVGVAFLPWISVQNDLKGRTLLDITPKGNTEIRSFRLVHQSGRKISAELEAAIKVARQVAKNYR